MLNHTPDRIWEATPEEMAEYEAQRLIDIEEERQREELITDEDRISALEDALAELIDIMLGGENDG